jgi:methionine-gamma-lyase
MGSMFEFDTVKDYMDCITGGSPYPMYTRGTSSNPTIRLLQSRLAAIYEAESALVTGSGMGAISTAFFQFLQPGDHVLFNRAFYMTSNLMSQTIEPKMGVRWDMVAGVDVEDFEALVSDRTKLIYLEIFSNPQLDVIDLEGITQMAHDRGIMVWVDDTVATPVNLRTFRYGVDVVTCSLTKYLSGHGDSVGGAIIGSSKLVNTIRLGCYAKVGTAISPFNAWLTLQGLKTLPLRVAQHNKNAQALAEYLEDHPKVEWVRYPGLKSHPQHERACTMMSGFGGMIGFALNGGDQAATIMADNMRFLGIGTSFGQPETLCETGLMIFYDHSFEERALHGVPDGFVRLSVGLEDTDDLIADMAQALDQVPEDLHGVREGMPPRRVKGTFRPRSVDLE